MLCEVWKPLNQDVTDIKEDVLVPENATCEVSLKSFQNRVNASLPITRRETIYSFQTNTTAIKD